MRALLLFVLVSAAGCANPIPTVESATESEMELRERVEHYYETLSARNWEAYRDFFWPEASLTTVWQPPGEAAPRVVFTSIDDFIANAGQGPDSKPIFEENLLSQEVRILENLGQVWARYEARFGDSTSVSTWRGVDAFTWMMHDGEWRIASMAYTNEADD